MFVKSTSFLGDMNPNWFFGIEPNAFGAIGALVSRLTHQQKAHLTHKLAYLQ
jgi:hypothetical protein